MPRVVEATRTEIFDRKMFTEMGGMWIGYSCGSSDGLCAQSWVYLAQPLKGMVSLDALQATTVGLSAMAVLAFRRQRMV